MAPGLSRLSSRRGFKHPCAVLLLIACVLLTFVTPLFNVNASGASKRSVSDANSQDPASAPITDANSQDPASAPITDANSQDPASAPITPPPSRAVSSPISKSDAVHIQGGTSASGLVETNTRETVKGSEAAISNVLESILYRDLLEASKKLANVGLEYSKALEKFIPLRDKAISAMRVHGDAEKLYRKNGLTDNKSAVETARVGLEDALKNIKEGEANLTELKARFNQYTTEYDDVTKKNAASNSGGQNSAIIGRYIVKLFPSSSFLQ